MKRIFASLAIVSASIGGFLWWKRNQVSAANAVAADPWPAAVMPVETPVETLDEAPEVEPTAESTVADKKSVAKKKTQKKLPQN